MVVNLIFEVKYVFVVDVEFGYFRFISGQSNEVFCDFVFVVGFFKELGFGSVGVGGSFSGGEGFGGDEEESCFRVRGFESFSYVSVINVGNEVEGYIVSIIVFKGFSDYDRIIV